MIHTQRASSQAHRRARSPPLISRPTASTDPYVTVSPPTSPRTSPPRGRRPSVSHAVNWLTRTASNTPYAPSKPIRISEPQFNLSLESLTITRSGALGKGATVVRTPQEALAGTSASYVDVAAGSLASASASISDHGSHSDEHASDEGDTVEDDDTRSIIPRPESPPLPPLPDIDSTDNRVSQVSSLTTHAPARPSRPPPAAPPTALSEETSESSTPRSYSKSISPARSILESFPPVPPLPETLSLAPQLPVPPFEPVLMTPSPGAIHMKDASKVLVILETSTMSHRTTLKSLTTRPSHLATYLRMLIPSNPRDSDVESIYSHVSDNDTPFNSVFRNLNPASQTTTTIHIFLDRPSEPYASVLSYLRSPLATPEHPVVLPRAAQLSSSSSSRVEALLDLRDEARFLGLEELEKLCSNELHQRQSMTSSLGLGLHMRGFSNASGHSARSLPTLRDHEERSVTPAQAVPIPKPSLKNDIVSASLQQRTPPRDRSRTRLDGLATMRSRPAGDWI